MRGDFQLVFETEINGTNKRIAFFMQNQKFPTVDKNTAYRMSGIKSILLAFANNSHREQGAFVIASDFLGMSILIQDF